MIFLLIPVAFAWATSNAEDYYYRPQNTSKSTLSGIAAYRSALTLDWLAAEDQRQRELAAAFETEPSPTARSMSTDCIAYARPASGKIARLMLDLLKNLEGDEGTIVSELIQSLIRTKLLVETSMLEAEPDLEALVKTPGVMMGEPHTTFPRILAMTWMTVTDPVTTKKYGWCPISKVNKYISVNKPMLIAKQMKGLEPVIARARFIMEEFIQHVTPLNMYQKQLPEDLTQETRKPNPAQKERPALMDHHVNGADMTTAVLEPINKFETHDRPSRTPSAFRGVHVALAQSGTTPIIEVEPMPNIIQAGETNIVTSGSSSQRCQHAVFLICIVIVL